VLTDRAALTTSPVLSVPVLDRSSRGWRGSRRPELAGEILDDRLANDKVTVEQ
jgi:hypothetical protein